jgi:hypothetical protein
MPKAPLTENLPDDKANAASNEKDLRNSDLSQDLDNRLDHGIKETFPGSDPVSVKVSKYALGDPRAAELASENDKQASNLDGDDPISGAVKQAREAAGAISETFRTTTQGLSENARRMAPQLKRGRNVVEETIRASPVPALIVAGLIGCGIALVAYEAMSKPRGKKLRRRAYGADEIS